MRHFATEKFKAFLFAGTLSVVVDTLGCFVHAVVAGHVIGEDALAGINMVSPLMIVVMFFACLIAIGTANNKVAYADLIVDRAVDPRRHVGIEIKIKK